jgi:hypothetical protein
VKAKTAAVANSHLWRKPFGELDWDKKAIRSSIEATLQAAGLPPVQDYLGNDLAPRPHEDAALINLGIEYARLLDIETPLHAEKTRLRHDALRQRWERLGINPDDDAACAAAFNDRDRYEEVLASNKIADHENGYDRACQKWNRAQKATARVGNKFSPIGPDTLAGLMIVLHVIETHDELRDVEPKEAMLAEIRDFARHQAWLRPSLPGGPQGLRKFAQAFSFAGHVLAKFITGEYPQNIAPRHS